MDIQQTQSLVKCIIIIFILSTWYIYNTPIKAAHDE